MDRKQRMYQQIENHGRNLLWIFPSASEQDPVRLCKRLRRLESEAHRLAEDFCNGVISSDDWDTAEGRVVEKVNRLLGPHDVPIIVNGDPRGCALKIDDRWVHTNRFDCPIFTDWGGYGVLAPEFDGK